MHICATSLRALAHRASLNGLMFDISSPSISPSLQSGVVRFGFEPTPPFLPSSVPPLPFPLPPDHSPSQLSFDFFLGAADVVLRIRVVQPKSCL